MCTCKFTLKPLLLTKIPTNNSSTLSFLSSVSVAHMYILFMLSNAFIKALHVKQIYKLMVKPAAGNCWLTTQSFLSKMRQAERDLLRISERGFWHKAQCFCGVLTAAWGSWASSQPPSYKAGPTWELGCTSHLEHRPSFPSCFRRRNLQTPTYTFWLLYSWVQLAW